MNTLQSVKIQRRFKAKPDTVYDAWTRPEIIARWWGPEGVRLADHSFDVTAGGSWRTVMVSKDGTEHIVGGIYRELRRPDRLVTTWRWEEGGMPGDPSLVTITFEAVGQDDSGSETLMTLVHEGLASQDSADAHKQGWISSLKRLADLWTGAQHQQEFT